MPKNKDSFTQKEIANAINNAIVFARAPNRLGEISEERLRKLRNYSVSLFQPLTREIDDEFVRPEEAVLLCLCGALFFQMKDVMGTDKVPAAGVVKANLGEKIRKRNV